MARLTRDNEARSRDLIALYPHHRSALIPMLHVLQEQDGYLTEDGMAHLGEMLGLSAAEVRGTATFYDMFHVEPVGRYVVAVCTNIACMLQGAYELLESIEEHLGVAPGGTTPDGMFTLEDAECLALCGNAPCLTVNWRFFGDVDPPRFVALVEDLRAGRLDAEVPPHGTLSRVGRTGGLAAQGASVHGAGGPPLAIAGSTTNGGTTNGSTINGGTTNGSTTGTATGPPDGGGAETADAVPQGVAASGPLPALSDPFVGGPADGGLDLGTSRTTTAVIALDGGRGLDHTGVRTPGRSDREEGATP